MVNFYSKIKILLKKKSIPGVMLALVSEVRYGVTLAARISDICEDSAMVGKGLS